MSKLDGQIWGGWAMFAGSIATLTAMLAPMPALARTSLTVAGVTAMLLAISLTVWAFTGDRTSPTPGSRAIVPARAYGAAQAVETNIVGPRRAATSRLRVRLPGKTAAPRRASA